MSRSGRPPVVRTDARGGARDRMRAGRGLATRISAVVLAALLGVLGGVVAYLLIQTL